MAELSRRRTRRPVSTVIATRTAVRPMKIRVPQIGWREARASATSMGIEYAVKTHRMPERQ